MQDISALDTVAAGLKSHAMDFSPARYWTTLFICDFIFYCFLVLLMTAAMVLVMVFLAPMTFHYKDLAVLPLMLTVYGISCIPQAYLFSLGPRAALNTMTFVMLNILFSETTIIASFLYGNALSHALFFMFFSPQFNMALAFMKIQNIFLYNSECIVFRRKNLCSSKTLHKCCPKCGILQECFSKQSYLSKNSGVLMEAFAILSTAVIFMIMLLLWEYKYFQRFWGYVISKWVYTDKESYVPETLGVQQEKSKVIKKNKEMKMKNQDAFGEALLACNLSQREHGKSKIRDVYLGLRRGEVLAVCGPLDHGRLRLCELLAVSFSCEHEPLPGWMRVRDALEMLAVLRGEPATHARTDVADYIDALELHNQADKQIYYLNPTDTARLHFAAAVVGAPPVVVLEEFTQHQKHSVQRAMYYILYYLRKRGHAIVIGSSSVETHLPVTNRLAILANGQIYDMDQVDNLVQRYSEKGFTVVVHLKDDVDVNDMFSRYFRNIIINDTSEVLANVQVLDEDLNYAKIFEKMEILQAENSQVYSYVVSATSIDSIYNSILTHQCGRVITEEQKSPCHKFIFPQKPKITPTKEALNKLIPFERRFHITKLKELPWSVIFNR